MAVLKIMIVEDETVPAMELENCLEDLGYNIVGMATNDKQAMNIFKDKMPDLVLMDVELKGSKMDGIQLAKALKKIKPIPVVFLTAHYNNAQIQQRVIASNPENFLFKPHDLNSSKLAVAIELAIRKFANDGDAELKTGNYREEDFLFIKKDGTHHKTTIVEISHVTTSKGGIVIFSEETFFPYNITLKKFAQKVIRYNDLIQVHQSYMVNLNKVTGFNLNEKTVTITFKYVAKENNQTKVKAKEIEIPIGREYKDEFLLRVNPLDTKS